MTPPVRPLAIWSNVFTCYGTCTASASEGREEPSCDGYRTRLTTRSKHTTPATQHLRQILTQRSNQRLRNLFRHRSTRHLHNAYKLQLHGSSCRAESHVCRESHRIMVIEHQNNNCERSNLLQAPQPTTRSRSNDSLQRIPEQHQSSSPQAFRQKARTLLRISHILHQTPTKLQPLLAQRQN